MINDQCWRTQRLLLTVYLQIERHLSHPGYEVAFASIFREEKALRSAFVSSKGHLRDSQMS
jgi:hypothetical protein